MLSKNVNHTPIVYSCYIECCIFVMHLFFYVYEAHEIRDKYDWELIIQSVGINSSNPYLNNLTIMQLMIYILFGTHTFILSYLTPTIVFWLQLQHTNLYTGYTKVNVPALFSFDIFVYLPTQTMTF